MGGLIPEDRTSPKAPIGALLMRTKGLVIHPGGAYHNNGLVITGSYVYYLRVPPVLHYTAPKDNYGEDINKVTNK